MFAGSRKPNATVSIKGFTSLKYNWESCKIVNFRVGLRLYHGAADVGLLGEIDDRTGVAQWPSGGRGIE